MEAIFAGGFVIIPPIRGEAHLQYTKGKLNRVL